MQKESKRRKALPDGVGVSADGSVRKVIEFGGIRRTSHMHVIMNFVLNKGQAIVRRLRDFYFTLLIVSVIRVLLRTVRLRSWLPLTLISGLSAEIL